MQARDTDIVTRARKFATQKHMGQRYGKGGYISHVTVVVSILEEFGYTDPIVLSAAWLHDVLETTHTSKEELETAFGIPVAYVVWAMTGEFGRNQIDRLQGLIAKLKSSEQAIAIKLADAIANIEFYKATGDARQYRACIKEILYLKEMLYKPKQKARAELLPLWKRLLEATALSHKSTTEINKMKTEFDCLSGVVITKDLADAIAAFEDKHGDKSEDPHAFGKLDELAGEFVKALVKFAREALEDPDNFYHESDEATAITLILFENGAGVEMQDAYDEIEGRLGSIEGGDEAYNLLIEVINAVVLTEQSKAKKTR
jgi:hypothetical protein